MKLKMLIALPLAPSLIVPAVACGGDYGGSPTEGAPDGSNDRTPLSGGDVGVEVPIVAVGLDFQVERVEVRAGAITVVFDNRDEGVLHNIHFYEGDSADGDTVALTDIKTGPVTDTLTMELDPGEYVYACDVHPTTMRGLLRATG